MTTRVLPGIVACYLCLAGAMAGWTTLGRVSVAWGDDEFAERVSWSAPAPEQVRGELEVWLATRGIDEATRRQIEAVWVAQGIPVAGTDVLERVADTVALVDQDARGVVALVKGDEPPVPLPTFPVLESESLPPVVRHNLRLLYGRWLAQNGLFDEAIDQLAALSVHEVADPASLLFYRGVAHHQLLKKKECLPDLTQLMRNEALVPRRFHTIARLMQADLQGLKADSLDEVARMMEDIRRRLDLGRAGKTVRKEEDDVIAKLDKMIEELEQQQQQQQQQSGGANAPNSPRPDSTPGGVKGPGNVDSKNTGNKSGWGNLPPKERQEALQNISRDLPAHFREAIDEYHKKTAHDRPKR